MWRTWRSITSWLQRFWASVACGRRETALAWRIGASGLRSSCASVARNSSLRRSASCSRRSSFLRVVTSVNHSATLPRIGEATQRNHCPMPS